MSRFLDSISTIISVFHNHAKEDGEDGSNLSRRKMKEFIETEFADVIAKPHDPQTIEKILQFLEWDGDGPIYFNEYLLLVFQVAKACYWYLPKEPYLLQRTKLTTSGKPLREPEIKSRGSRRQLQEEEQQTCERNRHPQCEPELRRDTRVEELETPEETRSQQRNTRRRNDAKRSREPGEPIPQEYEERSQEPCDQRNNQRRRQPPELDRRDIRLGQRSSSRAEDLRLQAEERQRQERPRPEQLEDVRRRSQTREPQPLPNRWSGREPREPARPEYDQRTQRPHEADRGSHDRPRRPELLIEEKSRYHQHELEQKALERGRRRLREPERLDARRPHQSYLQEPLEIDLRSYETCEPERGDYERVKRQEYESEYLESEREIDEEQEWDEEGDARREENVRERRIDRERELDLEVYERRRRQTREREERDATTEQRETRERRDRQTREREDDGRRQRETVRYERRRETEVAAAEADVRIDRVSRELEPREELERRDCRRACEEPEDERRIRQEREREEPLRERRIDRQRELDLDIYERRSRETRERAERDATTRQRETRER
ncbi:RPTN protein, partial [Todus mexicanus]|nr:RPTN protein [Todus mexicanus]